MLSRRRGGHGRQPYLDDDDMMLLGWGIETGLLDTAADVRKWIEAQCSVSYMMLGGIT